VTLWPSLPGGEVIDLLHRLRGSSAEFRAAGRCKAELLERFELDPTKKVRTYSKGNRVSTSAGQPWPQDWLWSTTPVVARGL